MPTDNIFEYTLENNCKLFINSNCEMYMKMGTEQVKLYKYKFIDRYVILWYNWLLNHDKNSKFIDLSFFKELEKISLHKDKFTNNYNNYFKKYKSIHLRTNTIILHDNKSINNYHTIQHNGEFLSKNIFEFNRNNIYYLRVSVKLLLPITFEYCVNNNKDMAKYIDKVISINNIILCNIDNKFFTIDNNNEKFIKMLNNKSITNTEVCTFKYNYLLNIELSTEGRKFSFRYLVTLYNENIYDDLNPDFYEEDQDTLYRYLNKTENDNIIHNAIIVEIYPHLIAIKLKEREIDRYLIEDNEKYKLFMMTVKYYNDVLTMNKSDCINYFENFQFNFLNKLRTVLKYGYYSDNISYTVSYNMINSEEINIIIENNTIYVELIKFSDNDNNSDIVYELYEPFEFIQQYSIFNIINIIIPFTVDFCIVNRKSNDFYMLLMNKVVDLHNEMVNELPFINITNDI